MRGMIMVSVVGVAPTTFAFGGRCSILLSYTDKMVANVGIAPLLWYPKPVCGYHNPLAMKMEGPTGIAPVTQRL